MKYCVIHCRRIENDRPDLTAPAALAYIKKKGFSNWWGTEAQAREVYEHLTKLHGNHYALACVVEEPAHDDNT